MSDIDYSEKSRLIKDWHLLKVKLHFSALGQKYFLERDIWWASIGSNIGYEEDGKNRQFDRPVLILKKFNKHLILIIPLSSKIKTDNKYYCKINFNNSSSSVIISQLRIISSQRLIRKIGKLDSYQFKNLIRMISAWWHL